MKFLAEVEVYPGSHNDWTKIKIRPVGYEFAEDCERRKVFESIKTAKYRVEAFQDDGVHLLMTETDALD